MCTCLRSLPSHIKQEKGFQDYLRFFWKLSFRQSRVGYRIAYEIDEKEKAVYVLMVGKRERFYERLERRAK
jgi:hypothetical protein